MRKIALFAAAMLAVSIPVVTATTASATPSKEHKSYVCKYVGTPGVDERLQTGQNPIWVDNSSLTGKDDSDVQVGDTFSDKQGKSVVIVANTPKLNPEPSIEDCPKPDGPTPTPTPTVTATPTPTTTSPTPTPTETTPSPTPTETETASPTPTQSETPVPVKSETPVPTEPQLAATGAGQVAFWMVLGLALIGAGYWLYSRSV